LRSKLPNFISKKYKYIFGNILSSFPTRDFLEILGCKAKAEKVHEIFLRYLAIPLGLC